MLWKIKDNLILSSKLTRENERQQGWREREREGEGGRDGERERERERERVREREGERVYFACSYNIIVMIFFLQLVVVVRGRLSPDKLLLND